MIVLRTWAKRLWLTTFILSCCFKDERERDLFVWYWENFLPKVFGTADWGPTSNMYYKTIIDCRISTSYSTRKRLSTPYHEAKAVIIWENNEEKWEKLWDFVQENPGKHQPNMGGKWTDTDSGQSDYTAWKDEGLQAYNTAKEEVRVAWKDKMVVRTLEEKCLEYLRVKYQFECSCFEEERKLIKKNKRRAANQKDAVQPKKRKVLSTINLADSEDEDED